MRYCVWPSHFRLSGRGDVALVDTPRAKQTSFRMLEEQVWGGGSDKQWRPGFEMNGFFSTLFVMREVVCQVSITFRQRVSAPGSKSVWICRPFLATNRNPELGPRARETAEVWQRKSACPRRFSSTAERWQSAVVFLQAWRSMMVICESDFAGSLWLQWFRQKNVEGGQTGQS